MTSKTTHIQVIDYEDHSVVRSASGVALGIIIPHQPWRCHVFEPDRQTIYSAGCLHDIATELERLDAIIAKVKKDEKKV